MKLEKRSPLVSTLFAVYMLLLIGVILFKLPFYSPELFSEERVINLIPYLGAFTGGGFILTREMAYNILLFVPLGIYLSLIKSKWPFVKKLLPVVGLTVAFEALQYIFALGRTDITDLFNNILGGLIGIGIYALLSKVFGNRAEKIVGILALMLTAVTVVYFAYLFFLSHFTMRR